MNWWEKAMGWVREVPAKVKVLLSAWPTWAVLITGLIQVGLDEIVPALPESWGLRAGAIAAGVLTGIGVVSAVVARTTPILFPQNRGLLAPPPAQSPGPQFRQMTPSHVRTSHDPDAPLPPVDPADYPPEAPRLPHRRPG